MSDSRFSYRVDPNTSMAASPATKMKLRKFGYKSALTFTDNFVAKKFGPQMPLMVAECLAKSSNAKEISTVKFSDSYGWSWLVCGRKLFVWPLSENNGLPDENATIVGKDLMLPPSDLAYSADLAVVFKTAQNQFVSCIAVSPEGVIRYWHTLRHYSNWVDVNSQLGGEEVYCVLDVAPLGVLAITTSASMLLIEPCESDGSMTVSVNIITDRQSWLGGFGKKVSAFLGYLPAPQFMESKAIKVITEELDNESWKVLVLVEHTLQQWLMYEGKYELLSETNLKSTVKYAFSERDEDPVSWEILDMKKYDSDSFMILAGCSKLKSVVILKFSMNDLNEHTPQPEEMYALSAEDFRLLHSSSSHRLSAIKFLPLQTHCFIYSNRIILAITLDNKSRSVTESLQFHNGYFLGGDMYLGTPVFFSTVHSYISVTPLSPLEGAVDSVAAVNSSLAVDTESIKELPASGKGTESTNVYNDAVKNSFLLHINKNISQAKAIISNTFSNVDGVDDSPLVKAVTAISEDIINQASSRDPRSSKKNVNFSEVSSLHLDVQMSQKEDVHGLYVLFVKDIISPEKLGLVTYNGRVTDIMDVLADHHEKIIAARALYQLRTQYSTVIYQAISKVADTFNFPKDVAMTIEEYFFTQVQYVYYGLKEMCYLPELAQKEGASYDLYLKTISIVNNILIDVLTKVIRASEKKQFLNDQRKYIESLASSSGLYESLKNQASLTANIGIKYESTLENAHEYMNQLFSLSDIILFTQKNYASPEDFHSIRTSLINYFVETKLYEQALMLAEKFTHYPTLVKICFLTNDVSRLNFYLEKYGDLGFCEELFKFYSNSRMYSHLLNLPLTAEFETRLSLFLNDYPDIAWIHETKKENYSKSFDILTKLGSRENDYALRKKRILSMAKLAREAGQLKNVNYDLDTQLHLLTVQEELPTTLLAKIGFSQKHVRAFSAIELIKLFICKENVEADEHHYKKALDLLTMVFDVEMRHQLWEKIWERALMTDRYTYQELGLPEETVNRMLLFKLINLIILTEDQPEELIPSYKTLTSISGLEDISNDVQLKYILKYGYEALCESVGLHLSEL